VWWGNLRVRVYLEDAGIEGRILLNWVFKKWDGGVEWMDLIQNTDGWWAFENATRNLQFP
jgi:hypothetical protein